MPSRQKSARLHAFVLSCVLLVGILAAVPSGAQETTQRLSEEPGLGSIMGFQYAWSRYRLIAEDGVSKRLLRMWGDVGQVQELRLRLPDGNLLDTELFVHGIGVALGAERFFGFWIPEPAAGRKEFVLERTDTAGRTDQTSFACAGLPPGDEKPLRLDRTGEWLRRHMLDRERLPEAKDLAAFVPDMEAYLEQHRIVYEKPASFWGEGLILGNGVTGALVAGERGKRQTVYLDRGDLWGSMPDGRPMGRFYGATLEIRYSVPQGGYHQELLLDKAQVTTRDGDLLTTAWVCADRDVAVVEWVWKGKTPLPLEVGLERAPIPMAKDDEKYSYSMGSSMSRINGNWNTSGEVSGELRNLAEQAPHTNLAVRIQPETATLRHDLPNMSCAVSVAVKGAACAWQDRSSGRTASMKTTFLLRPGRSVVLAVAVTSDRESKDPVAQAVSLLRKTLADPDEARQIHRNWWRNYWKRSFVEMPDKLMENQWYFGAYHQASYARGLQAPSFFGLWHPLDWRCWLDNYTADVQPPMLFWGTFPINHLELLLPSHNTYGRLVVEYLEHNRFGGSVPNHGFPVYGGGHISFGVKSYKGVTAWLSQNFYDDFQYTRDAVLLESITYPMLAAFADFFAGELRKGPDGFYHCSSGSPEQTNTSPDNVYDRANIERCLRSAIEAADFLRVDSQRSSEWRNVLDRLFPYPVDAATLCETLQNKHPYRCHASVMYPVFPSRTVEPGTDLWEKIARTFDTVTNLIGHNPYGRHNTIPGHEGGIEPNAFNTAFLLTSAARLRGWNELERMYYALVPRLQLKRNGQMSIADVRHSPDMVHMSIAEGVSGLEAALTETLVQQYADHMRLFESANPRGVSRFSGLRAFGGFELAGEYADGKTRSVTVHSLKGNTLRLMNPWQGAAIRIEPPAVLKTFKLSDGKEGLEIQTDAGKTYRLMASDLPRDPLPAPVMEQRVHPRSIPVRDGADFDPKIVYFPTDRLFPQFSRGDRVYLGMPLEEESASPKIDMDRIKAFLKSSDWRDRQTAARWLHRVQTPEAETLLNDLARNDPDPVVRLSALGNRVEKQD